MKLNTSSSLKLISFFPLMLLLLLSSYFMYLSYLQYQDTQIFQNRLKSNKILKNLSINLARERGLSATYYGSKGKLAKDALKKQRKLTNNAIREFNSYFKNKPIDTELTKAFRALTQISNIRASVNKMSITFDKMFFGYYSKVNSLLYEEYKKISDIQMTPEITAEVALETNLFQEMDRSGQERGFISYIIAKERPFSTEEFSSWLRIFSQADLTNFSINIADADLKNKLFAIFHNVNAKRLYNILVRAKINIIEGSDIGYYQIDPATWFGLMSQKIALLNRADTIVGLRVGAKTTSWFENEVRPKLTLAAGVLFLTIFLLIIAFFIDRYIKRSIKELEKLFSKVGQLADIDEEIDFQTTEGIEKGYRIIEIAIDQIQQDKKIALEASKAKSIFLANMSHEIRTPLNGIIGFTELLKNTNISGEERDFVNIIEKSSENLLEIINNILDLSKIESDKIEVEEILFSPIAEFENAVEVFAAKAAEKNIRLSFYMDPSLSNYLNGDPTKIKEVLINLLSNAIKFTPIDGEIDVEIKRLGNVDAFGRTKVQFAVRDNGIGISEDKLKTIFDAFSQADSTITRKYGGTGLGLTISSKFISMMGGKLEVESKVGEGTKFFFTLEFDESPSSEFNFRDEFTEYKCALLASEKDRKYHTQYVYDYLKYFGCDVIFFYSHKEIKGLMYRENINFVILDVDYIDEDEIEDYKNITIPGIVILKSSMQAVANKYTNDYIKPLYEPVNVTKLASVLEKQKEFLPKVKENKATEESKEEIGGEISTKEHDFETKEHPEEESKLRILVAEDNDINRKLIKRTLENYNTEVTLANNGEEALNEVKSRKFDLIFMDIAMPVMDGVEALHAILNYELNTGIKHTPIVALTANALKGDRERFLNEGFDEYVTKPIKGSSIEVILQTFLSEKYHKEGVKEQTDSSKDIKQAEESEEKQETAYDIEDALKENKEESDRKLKVHFDDKSDLYSGFKDDINESKEAQKQTLELETEELESETLWEEDVFFSEEEYKEEVEPKSFENKDEIEPLDIGLKTFDKEEEPLKEETSEETKHEEIKSKEIEKEPEVFENEEKSIQIDVLIAEDNVINQKLIEKTLTSLGLNVEISNNGEEALEKFKKKKYDIVFMDISMPVMDGIEATHEILAYEKENGLEHTPVIALTANALPGDREAFLSEGLDEYISKPLKKEDIVKVLKIFLNYKTDDKKDNSNKEVKKEKVYDDFVEDLGGIAEVFEEEQDLVEDRRKDVDVTPKDVLVYKNNQIEAKILSNMIEKMGYGADRVYNFDEFLMNMENNQYKVILFDKEMEFVDKEDIIEKIQKMDKQRGEKTFIVEFVSVQDSNKEEDLSKVDEILDSIINKKRIKEILEKYIR